MNRAQVIIFGSIGVIALLALGLVTGIVPGLKERPPAPFTLTVWSPEDEPELWQSIASRYRDELKSAAITYVRKDAATYEEELINALAAGEGPDIFFLASSKLAQHRDKISPLADGSLGYQKKNLKNLFADAIAKAITDEAGRLLGTPLYLDTLALFFNRDYLNAANIPNPPQTWDELTGQSRGLTRLSSLGSISRSGVAMGTGLNVEHAADIFVALIYQSGGAILSADGKESALSQPATAQALSFYTAFSAPTKKTYAWNALFKNSLQAFAAGEAAMAFGYSQDAPLISAQNPQLNFDTTPLPQTAGASSLVNIGRFGLLGVTRTSPQPEQAWRFLLWLQSKDIHKLYLDARGLPPARRDLVSSKPPRDYLLPFYDQVLSARLIPIELGDSLPKIFGDMIEGVSVRRLPIDRAISRASEEIGRQLSPRP